MARVRATDVTKTYGDETALDGVSIAVEASEVVALVGPNGAGKTTLVRALTGTTTPDSGSVEVLGSAPDAVDRPALGVLPQSFSPPDRLTASELLQYYAGLYDDARDPDDVLSEVGLAEAGSTRYHALSGGQQRRVCLGTTLVNEPSVLVLDEPTTGIDPAGRRTVRRLVSSLAADGTGVLVTTHDMDEAERIADRVVLLADGAVRASGTPAELIDEYAGPPRLHLDVAKEAVDPAGDALADAGYDVTRERSAVVVLDVDPQEIAALVDVLAAADVPYEELAWRRPSLEDAYVALAGDAERTARIGSPANGGDGNESGDGGGVAGEIDGADAATPADAPESERGDGR